MVAQKRVVSNVPLPSSTPVTTSAMPTTSALTEGEVHPAESGDGTNSAVPRGQDVAVDSNVAASNEDENGEKNEMEVESLRNENGEDGTGRSTGALPESETTMLSEYAQGELGLEADESRVERNETEVGDEDEEAQVVSTSLTEDAESYKRMRVAEDDE